MKRSIGGRGIIISNIDWTPTNGIRLDDEALSSIYQRGNVSVIAGPGAGKTELLTQKAGFLFETGTCKPRKKILAISFKVDAAKNLEERVKKRYGKETGIRFESKTFDSFAKSLLDQFISAVPENYRPKKDYEIILDERDVIDIVESYLIETHPSHPGWKHEYSKPIFLKKLIEDHLPLSILEGDLYSWIVNKAWTILIKGSITRKSYMTFPMISIVLEYILRTNPLLVKAIRSAYTHVFIDEFQDTTTIQYRLLKTLFLDSNVEITVVGDEKQRIMGWAGAMVDAFEVFKADFNSQEFFLINNFRSAPELVRIQNVFANELTESNHEVNAVGEWEEASGICEVWLFDNHFEEGEFIATSIKKWIEDEHLNPRDFCFITKQQEHIYARPTKDSLKALGIDSRVEKEYENLLSDDLVDIILSVIVLAFSNRNFKLWSATVEWFAYIKSKELISSGDFNLNKLEQELSSNINRYKAYLEGHEDNMESQLTKVIDEIVEFISLEQLRSLLPKYKQTGLIEYNIKTLKEKLLECYKEQRNWTAAVEDFKGEFSIPIMTIHKSKGREYDTVIFIGLEDGAFWSFKSQSEADKKAFFVALSRAKKRVVFTFSKSREVLKYRQLQTVEQSFESISDLYNLLKEAEVSMKIINK